MVFGVDAQRIARGSWWILGALRRCRISKAGARDTQTRTVDDEAHIHLTVHDTALRIADIQISGRAPVAELVGQLSARDHGLARVLLRCSYLCDGIAIRGPSIVLNVGPTLDVSPPFAGG